MLCVALALPAQERWTAFRSGPFEVLTSGGHRQARDALTKLEQFRHTFGAMLSKPDLRSVWPIRVVMLQGSHPSSPTFTMSRDSWIAGLAQGRPVPPRWLKDCGRILLDSNTGPMPAGIEEGLLELFSTLDVQVTRVTLGAPPSVRTAAWSHLHLLAVNPEYSGKLRVLLANLQQGMDEEPAYRNAFGRNRAEIEREGGVPGTISLIGRPLDPDFDFPARPVEPSLAPIITADLLATRTSYEAVQDSAEVQEGLGFVAIGAGRADEARSHFRKAVELGSRNARAHLEAGDPRTAAKLNPRWAEPYLRMAAAEKDPRRKATLLDTAARLDPRNATNLRRAAKRLRDEMEAADQRRLADERARELAGLKNEANQRVRAAESKAAQINPPLEPDRKVEPWWGDNKGAGARLEGVLERVDCLKGQARLAVRGANGKLVQLLIRDPAQIVIEGGGERTLGCGPQKPPRKLAVEYTPRADGKTQTSGDATFLRFQ